MTRSRARLWRCASPRATASASCARRGWRGCAPPPARTGGDDDAALEDFLRALAGATRPGTAAPRPLPAGEVLPFQPAPAPTPACDLDRLPGAGPGLVLALRRAGLPASPTSPASRRPSSPPGSGRSAG